MLVIVIVQYKTLKYALFSKGVFSVTETKIHKANKFMGMNLQDTKKAEPLSLGLTGFINP